MKNIWGVRRGWLAMAGVLLGMCLWALPLAAQQTVGNVNGTVLDASGAAVPATQILLVNVATGLTRQTRTNGSGQYHFFGLPIGTYQLTFRKTGFKRVVHSNILVQANRTSTVPATLQPGSVATTVNVTATPLLNRVNTTNGYVLSSKTIQSIPLGTGSFTQLATLSPGVNADLLSGSGTASGLGNQDIWANGQRDTSNSFSFNGINTSNIFNGKSSSSVAENRFVLNTGENFLSQGGAIQTNTSVYDAIGQGLPTPPPATIAEERVNASMYDASEGSSSGAHIEVVTKSGTNSLHGQIYWHHQTGSWNAAPFFYNADPTIPQSQKVPSLSRNTYGLTIGGPLIKNKLFFFTSYQAVRASDRYGSTSFFAVPPELTNDRSPAALAQVASTELGSTVTTGQLDPAAVNLMNAKVNGQYLIPTPNAVNSFNTLGYDVVLQGPDSTFNADQINENIDYNLSDTDHVAMKYYFQNDPTTSPFAVSNSLGFGQSLQAGSQVFSLANTRVLSSNLTWEAKLGFVRQIADASTQQPFTPQSMGINVPGSTEFPGIFFSTSSLQTTQGGAFSFGPASNFANAGVFQNQWAASTTFNWVVGNHNLSFGADWNHSQLNVVNRNNQVASLTFRNFASFLQGQLRLGQGYSSLLAGSSNRYYRANSIGFYAQDNWQATPNLNLSMGLRYDYDGPLTEAHGMMTNFYPQLYKYNAATDTIVNSGLVVAGNNPQYATPGVSASTLQGQQYGIAPRIGLAWTPGFNKNLVVRAGYGLYYDRGEFFSEFSPSAGNGQNGPFGVTVEPPFVLPILSSASNTLSNPFPTPPTVTGNPAIYNALLANAADLVSGNYPCVNVGTQQICNQFGSVLFGGYDPNNKLPYSENWMLDLQWQPFNTLSFTLGYTGNHGQHQVLPIPFNQAGIATPTHPIHGQIYSYGYNTCVPDSSNANDTVCLPSENVFTPDGGNTDLRAPFLGYSDNSVFYEAEGISNYDALEFSVNKRISHGLMINGSYTWSHALDEGSGLQLFYNGNNPLAPHSGYGNAGYDRTHVFALSYVYNLPNLIASVRSGAGRVLDGWRISGVTTYESGQPYSVYDFSGAVGGLYYSTNDYITNPLVPLKPGVSVQQAELQSSTNFNPAKPMLNASDFSVNSIISQPGQNGVPPCANVTNAGGQAQQVCDNFETLFGATGRNIFRAPFQTQFNFSIAKAIPIGDRYSLNYEADVFNLFNTPSFDAPNNNVEFNPYFANPPYDPITGNTAYSSVPFGNLGMIQHTIGSPRFIKMSLSLTF